MRVVLRCYALAVGLSADTANINNICRPGDSQCDAAQVSAPGTAYGKLVPWPEERREQIIVLDDLFSESDIRRYHKLLKVLDNYRDEHDHPDLPTSGRSADLLNSQDPFIELLIAQLLERASLNVVLNTTAARGTFSFSGNLHLNLYRAYVNWFNSSDTPWPHPDAYTPDHVTVLLYVNPASHVRNGLCGGETMFFDHEMEVLRAIKPKPGRICIFTGRLWHSARPFLPLCKQPRLTVALKFHAKGLPEKKENAVAEMQSAL